MKIIHIKIFITLIISLLVMKVISNQIFIANTPRINPMFIAKLRNMPKTIASVPGKIYDALFPKNTNKNIATQYKPQPKDVKRPGPQRLPVPDDKTYQTIIQNMPLQQIAKGVYAGEDKIYNVSVFKFTQDAQWEEIEYTAKDGKKYKLLRPKTE